MSNPPPSSSGPNSLRAGLSRSGVGRSVIALSRRARSLSGLRATGRFLRQQLWIWPLVAATGLAVSGWWVSRTIKQVVQQRIDDSLQTVLDADLAALQVWLAQQRANAQVVADDPPLGASIAELLTAAETEADLPTALAGLPAQRKLRAQLAAWQQRWGYAGFFLVSPEGVVLAADQDPPVGHSVSGYRDEFFQTVLASGASVSQPYRSPLLLTDEQGEVRADVPTMFAAAPVMVDGRPVAVLGLRIRPELDFTRILQTARLGETGEVYAFNRQGLLLSASRFDEELKQIGLLVDQPEVQSILTLELRDPQVDMTAGERPHLRRPQQPLTRMVAAAVTGEHGSDVLGYRDYRGVPVVGAWQWLDELDMGVAAEIDVAEAYRPLYLLRRAFFALIGLLGVAAVVIYLAMWYLARQQRALQKAVLAARQLGQYTLEHKLGAGGMGTVYQARHALLRRPTAVKLLDPDRISEEAVARFEREVQLTASLTHPNTVAIYDYGRTGEGLFYYVMEYLDGVNLEQLIAQHGPLPQARAAYLLKQACGALAEAHALGLIHRDIKPANIFLTVRGGLHDFVKVLDFGLAKAAAGGTQQVSSAGGLLGTPLYMSPEAIAQGDSIGPAADVYALGAVGYFLLVGQPVFDGGSIVEICLQHTQQAPRPPSARVQQPIAPEFERLLLRCLAKSPAERPADAAALLAELEACELDATWDARNAAQWWAAAVTIDAPVAHAPTPATEPLTNNGLTVAYAGTNTAPTAISPTPPQTPLEDATS